jgi:hypothetical protein
MPHRSIMGTRFFREKFGIFEKHDSLGCSRRGSVSSAGSATTILGAAEADANFTIKYGKIYPQFRANSAKASSVRDSSTNSGFGRAVGCDESMFKRYKCF